MERAGVRHWALVMALTLLFTAGVSCGAVSESTADNSAVETVVENSDSGYWLYENQAQGVRIEIHRYEDKDQTILWYEADLQFSAESPIEFLTANAEDPVKGFVYPEKLARDNGAVFAINDDQFGYHLYNHKKSGIIIRNKAALYSATRENGNLGWPTLDTAAFFGDGTMRVYQSEELTPQQYVDIGAQTVLSFGPWLVRDGKTNPLLTRYFKTREPRSAIGMIGPYHFVVLSVERAGKTQPRRGCGMASGKNENPWRDRSA